MKTMIEAQTMKEARMHSPQNLMSRPCSAGVLLGLLLLGSAAGLLAQATHGSIAGAVTDQSQSVIPGVTIVAKQDSTGQTRSVSTNSNGLYSLPQLVPGSYSLTFTRDGFQKVLVQANVVVSEITPVNVIMPVGKVSEVVTVNDLNTAIPQTSTSSLGRVAGEEQVQDLPLATRNFTQIMTLSPGTSAPVNNATATGRGTQTIYDNGARAASNGLTIDGIDAVNIHTGVLSQNAEGSNGVPIPSPEAIQEFKVQTGLYDAQYGRNGGTNTAVITRLGGEQYHGSIYEYLRNTDLDANLYFLRVGGQPRPVLNQNQFGGVLGGPILKLKNTHFFASYQGTRQTDGVSGSITDTLPTGLYDSDRSAAALGAYYGGTKGRYGTLAVAPDGSNISPVALALLNYKLPNGSYVIPSPQSNAATNNYSTSIPSTFHEDGWLLDLDHAFSDKNTFAARGLLLNDPEFNSFGEASVPGFGETQDFKSRGFNFSDTHLFSANVVNTALVGLLRTMGTLTAQTVLPISAIGMNRFNSSIFNNIPRLHVVGGEGVFELGYTADGNEGGAQNTFQYADTLALIKGKNNLRVGGEMRHYQDNYYDYNFTLGAIELYSFADFLLGAPSGPIANGGNGSTTNGAIESSEVSSTKALRNDRLTDYAAFIQDDYAANRKLTLNLGLRWEHFGFAKDLGGRNGNFVPSLYSPPPSGGTTSAGFVQPSNAQPLLPGIPIVSPIFLNHNMWTSFEPRVGLAYAVTNSIVFHAGYGIFYDRISNQVGLHLALAPPNYFRSDLSGSEAQTFSLANPFTTNLPAMSQLPKAPLLYDPFTYPSTDLFSGEAVDPNLKSPYMQQYMANIQWQASRDLLLEVGYVGSKGVKLPGRLGINQAQLASPSNPINGITTNTTNNVDERVPFLGASSSGLLVDYDNADSRYNSVQVSATKSLRYGLQLLASYTLSRSVDDDSGASDSVFNQSSGDQTNIHQATGPSDFDRPSRLVVSGIYDVPSLDRYLRKNALTKGLFNNWELSWVVMAQNGTPFTVTDGNGALYYGSGMSRANYALGATNSTAKKSGSAIGRLTDYFNKAAFVTAGDYYGDVPRNSLRSPGASDWDISILKSIHLAREADFQFRAEIFNAFNHTNFASPGSEISSGSTFGVISSTVGNPRIVQFSGRIAF